MEFAASGQKSLYHSKMTGEARNPLTMRGSGVAWRPGAEFWHAPMTWLAVEQDFCAIFLEKETQA